MSFFRKRSVALVLSSLIVLFSTLYMVYYGDVLAEEPPPVAEVPPIYEPSDIVVAEPISNPISLPFSSLLLTFEADTEYTVSDSQTLSFSLPPYGVLNLFRAAGVGPNPTIGDAETVFEVANRSLFENFSHLSFGPIEETTVHGKTAFVMITNGFDEVNFRIATFLFSSDHFSYAGLLVTTAEAFDENYAKLLALWENIKFLEPETGEPGALSERMITVMYSNFRITLSEDIEHQSSAHSLDLDFSRDRLAILFIRTPGSLAFDESPAFYDDFTHSERIAYLYELAYASGDVFETIEFDGVEIITINDQTAYEIHVRRYRGEGDPIRDRHTILGLFEVDGVFYEYIFNTEYDIFQNYYPHFRAIMDSIQ